MKEFYYQWQWELKSSPEQFWPYLADTNRFNHDTGVPAVEEQGVRENNTIARHFRARLYGVPIAWREEPFEWVRPTRMGVVRHYAASSLLQPLARLHQQATLTSRPEGGSHLRYEVWVRPRHLLGLIAIPIQVGLLLARRFDRTIRRYDRLAQTGQQFLIVPGSANFPAGGRRRLAALSQTLLDEGHSPQATSKLVELIEQADDLSLDGIRPYVLADYWGLPRKEILELCLAATRLGLLDLRWELLCPLCRGASVSGDSLSKITGRAHCDTCNIDYEVNFDQSVELTFQPNPAVRLLAEKTAYCMAGPQVTPHIAVQQIVPAGTEREIVAQLEEGRYRLRVLHRPGGQYVRASDSGREEATLSVTPNSWPPGELQLARQPKLHFKNETNQEQLLILERIAWSDQAATAAEVTAIQRFRDLFASEVLRPGEQISVNNVTLIFTDLRQSTRMYREIGDAPAFGVVMNHFDVLRQAIDEQNGAIVKTIGDAVMAVFRRPISAMLAVLQAQHALANPPAGTQPLYLKAGLHLGPCIAVNLNDRLDYFGSTVNLAARLVDLSNGEEIILSEPVFQDPEISDLLNRPDVMLQSQKSLVNLKGFDNAVTIWRIRSEPTKG